MKYLGVFPTEKKLVNELIPEMEDDEPTGFISYKKFETKLLQLLATNEFEPDSGDIVLQAFRVLDTEGLGYLSMDTIENVLCSKGEAFRPQELELFAAVAKDPETGNVFYEDYVSLLVKSQQPDTKKR